MPRLPHPRTALSGYADARLPRWRRAVVERHLRGCTRCAVEVAQIRALGSMLRAPLPDPDLPPGLIDRLLALGGEAVGADDDRRAAPGPQVSPHPAPRAAAHAPGGVGAAGVLVVAVVLLGTVVAGSAATGVGVPWPSASTRASLSTVLPRPWPGGPETGADEPGGAVSVRPVDDGPRP